MCYSVVFLQAQALHIIPRGGEVARPEQTKISLKKSSIQNRSENRFRTIHIDQTPSQKRYHQTYFDTHLVESMQELHQNFYEEHQIRFQTVVSSYLESRLTNSPKRFLFEKLVHAFLYTAKIHQEMDQERIALSGIYVIYHLPSEIAYIGESWNIQQRCVQHQELLREEKHHNGKLQTLFSSELNENQEDSTESELEPFQKFLFLFLEIGLLSKEQRLVKEMEWIQNWPGTLCNVIHNGKTATNGTSINSNSKIVV